MNKYQYETIESHKRTHTLKARFYLLVCELRLILNNKK